MKTAKHLFLFVAILSLFVANTAWTEEKKLMNSNEIMVITDLNEDNRIDIEEYHHRVTEVYFFLDTNKDGKLTVIEIQRNIPNVDTVQIKNADVNGDAIITIYEFHYILDKDFEAMDKNQDGTLDKQEMKTFIKEEDQ
jgi:Ca2+-binding EF-hand superfamily protein